MTNTLTPLTSAELADLKAKAKIIPVIKSATILRLIDMIERLQSGDMKREIENAAFERCERLANDVIDGLRAGRMSTGAAELVRNHIVSLIQPPAQKENGE